MQHFVRKIVPQPRWPEGESPERITHIRGGFKDGFGDSFAVPVGFHCQGAERSFGTWFWHLSRGKVETLDSQDAGDAS